MTDTSATHGYDIEGLLAATDRLDAEAYGRFLTPDATLRFSNLEPVHGRAEIVAFVGAVFATLGGLHHELVDAWTVGDTVIAQLRITFDLPGRDPVTLPAAAITRTRDGLLVDHQVYINDGPLGDAG
jgi:ketosteroid isomerase-like protein